MSLSREQILSAVREGNGRYTKRDLVRALSISGDERRALKDSLREMTLEGTLVRNERKAYRAADTLPGVMVLAVDHVNEDGDLIGRPAKWEQEGAPPQILIIDLANNKGKNRKPGAPLGAGDRVLCKISKRKNQYQGEVIRKLGRAPRTQLGVVVKGGRGLRIRPVEKGSRYDFIPEKSAKIVVDDMVLFTLTQARHKGERIARVVKSVGKVDSVSSISLISLYAHNIPVGFSEAEIAQAKGLKLPKLEAPRQDLRALPFVTIDPDDAKDFDDAIFVESDPKVDGGFYGWVAIADVSAFVMPGSQLDKGAYKRGNSVYLPDRVVPMLPEEISADLCSLRPNEDRACLVVRMRFDALGQKTGEKFMRGLMRSHARLTYAQAQAAFDGKPGDAAMPVMDALSQLWQGYEKLRDARARRAPLEIDMPERKVRLGAKGKIVEIEVRERFDAHKLVEEFMIQANVAAAQALESKHAEFIYRVHDVPSLEKVQGLSDFLPTLGLKWSMGARVTPKRFNRLLEQARAKDLGETVSMSILRAQMQAYYSPKNAGHFGLNLTHYAHFTSPIRRYADLTVHRALVSAFTLGDGGQMQEERTRLPEIAEHISDTERRAMAAERDANDRYIALFLKDKVGAEFEGRITGVTRAGLFIQLDETGADAYAPISKLGNERFLCDDKTKCLIGSDTGGTYKFGAKVRVRLDEAMPLKGGLIVDVLTSPQKGKPPKRTGQNRSYKKKKYKGKKRR